jgi:hypothetical protein
MLGFIDPPGRYAPRKQWQEFLARMKTLPENDRKYDSRSSWREALARLEPNGEISPRR